MYSIDALILVAVLAVFLGLAGGALGATLLAWVNRANADRTQMAEKIKSLEAEMEALRRSGPKRNTHIMAEGFEDALGIAIDVLEEYASAQRYTEARVRQLYEVLKKLREGPSAYDPDEPARERPKRRHEMPHA